MRSDFTPPKIMPPSRPFPTGIASCHSVAGCVNQSESAGFAAAFEAELA
jgi:hypothetical protein